MPSAFIEQTLPDFIAAREEDVTYNINKKFKKMIKEELKRNVESGLWDEELPDNWVDDIDIVVSGKRVNVKTNSEAIKAHEEGVERHPQMYLLGKVIPIEKGPNGEKRPIFRKCTMKSLMQGKFWHPGMAGKGFIEDAIDTAASRAKEVIQAAHKADDEKHNRPQEEEVY